MIALDAIILCVGLSILWIIASGYRNPPDYNNAIIAMSTIGAAVGTISATIVALFREQLRAFICPP